LDKKAKDRNWSEVFAVIEKGYMSLFSFSSKSKSKGKAAGGVVGGGNWQENAKSLGSFLLRQTIASALPSPGYSKARPHVWALSLPTGAVHLFQVGTPDIVKEFVSTANYWSARLSNHPLVGGICNIEYGWSDAIVNNSLVNAINESTRPSTRQSMQSSRSLRSSVDHPYAGSFKARLPGDKITISDWTPPTQSMRASNLMETDQLRTLSDYVAGIEEELQRHNQLRSPMLLAVSHLPTPPTWTPLTNLSFHLGIPTPRKPWQTGKESPLIFSAKSSSLPRTSTAYKLPRRASRIYTRNAQNAYYLRPTTMIAMMRLILRFDQNRV
jgi:hypothetical protein